MTYSRRFRAPYMPKDDDEPPCSSLVAACVFAVLYALTFENVARAHHVPLPENELEWTALVLGMPLLVLFAAGSVFKCCTGM